MLIVQGLQMGHQMNRLKAHPVQAEVTLEAIVQVRQKNLMPKDQIGLTIKMSSDTMEQEHQVHGQALLARRKSRRFPVDVGRCLGDRYNGYVPNSRRR